MNEESRVEAEAGREDEIDLFDLWDDILQEKLWVILGFMSCVSLALVYALTTTPIYESKVVVKPASANSVVELNVPQLSGIYSKTVDDAYADARSALLSKENRRNFYETFIDEIKSIDGLYDGELTLSQNFIEFDKLFSSKVSNSKKDVEEYLQVSLELPDAEKVAQLLNAYAQFTLAAKLVDVKDTLESKVRAQVDKYEYDAKQLREKYKGEQTRRNLMVSEAYTIAEAVGQDQPLFSKSEIVGTYEPPLYMFGTKALKAEEKAIKNREKLASSLPYGEDHFIDKLPELQFKINQLKTLEIDYSKVDLAVIDEQAVVPVSAIKPKKKLIVALAGVAGVFAGLMLALIMAAFKRHKEKIKTKIKARVDRA